MSTLTSHDSRLTIRDILKQFWGFDTFRPLQEEVITSILDGNDALALMPTGGGKSLCYQVPALAKEGLCLVISPLIALMKDQVENLRRKNITAFAIYAGLSRYEVINVLKTALNSNCKFLYVSPERLETNLFKEFLPGMEVSLIAVDEAHCISQWGYDFRPPYLRIAALREELPGIPVLALTASATVEVQDDICDKLHFKTKNVFCQSFERANLSYSVFNVDSKINKLIEILKNVPGSSIIYCKSRKRTKEVSDLLLMHGFSSEFYHAGLTQEERNRRQEKWINNQTRVIVCTNAFGMGIDKPDVRVVVHADAPDCLENYYQEAGRAGRDGKKSYAVLLYNEKDIEELKIAPTIRFPSTGEIKNVYEAVANYLQVATGVGEGEYFDFDLVDFMRKFKLNSQTTLYALKSLEQEGWFSFNEQTFVLSTVQFICDKNYLYHFEAGHPNLEPMIKTLLRAYEGIFDNSCSISETQLQRLLNAEKGHVTQQLLQLHSFGIVRYVAQKNGPQLLFFRNRARTEDICFDLTAVNQRKKRFTARVETMIDYINERVDCRSRIIASYFGDHNVQNCGVCDNCLNQKALEISKEEFEFINERIVNSVSRQSIHTRQLLQQLIGIKKEKAWKVINFLQAENKIELDKSGHIHLK